MPKYAVVRKDRAAGSRPGSRGERLVTKSTSGATFAIANPIRVRDGWQWSVADVCSTGDRPRGGVRRAIMCRVLIVDDDDAILAGLKEFLTSLGHEVDCAREAAEAHALITHVAYGLVISDLKLTRSHGAEGFEILRFVRENHPRTALILLTGHTSSDVAEEARRRGADAVLAKPASLQRIAAVMSHVLSAQTRPQAPTGGIFDRANLSVVLQPIFEIGPWGQRLHALEGLIRGPKDSNLERPDVMFEYAHQKLATGHLDTLCMQTILAAAADLPRVPTLSLNVHGSTLASEQAWTTRLAEAARAHAIPLSQLIVEIVERGPVADETSLRRAIEALRGLGIRVAVDDIGNGESNYQRILNLRPDYFKLDRGLVQGVHADPARRTVLTSIAHMAVTFDARVVAEGVETSEDLEAVRAAGISLVQGYLLSRPMTARRLVATGILSDDMVTAGG